MAGGRHRDTSDECVSTRARSGGDNARWFQSVIGTSRKAMRKRDVMRAKWTNEKRKKPIRACRCMIGFAIDSVGAADEVCVGEGLVGGL